MKSMPVGDVESAGKRAVEMALKPLSGNRQTARGLAAVKAVQAKQQRTGGGTASLPPQMKVGCISVWAIAGLFMFSLLRPAGDPVGELTTPEQAAAAKAAAASAVTSAAAGKAVAAPVVAPVPHAERATTLATLGADSCGCLPGSGWSVSTGRGCCKPGSNTQAFEESSCRATLGNTDCTAAAAAEAEKKAPVSPDAAAGVVSDAAIVAAAVDGCGCTGNFGWSLTTGRGCCKSGSNTQDFELEGCRASLGNTECTPEAAKSAEGGDVAPASSAKDGDAPAVAAAAAAVAAPAACTGAGGEVFLHTLTEDNSHVGYGRLGKGNSLGFEGITAKVNGQAYNHILSMHPGGGSRGTAVVDYTMPATASGGKYCAIGGQVAINDKNNFFGRAGSPLTFRVYDATGCATEPSGNCALTQPNSGLLVLWESQPVQVTESVQDFRVDLPASVTKLRLEVAAQGSNACAHAVWLEPKLIG